MARGAVPCRCFCSALSALHPAIDRDGVRERVIGDIAEIFKGRLVWGEDLMRFEL